MSLDRGAARFAVRVRLREATVRPLAGPGARHRRQRVGPVDDGRAIVGARGRQHVAGRRARRRQGPHQPAVQDAVAGAHRRGASPGAAVRVWQHARRRGGEVDGVDDDAARQPVLDRPQRGHGGRDGASRPAPARAGGSVRRLAPQHPRVGSVRPQPRTRSRPRAGRGPDRRGAGGDDQGPHERRGARAPAGPPAAQPRGAVGRVVGRAAGVRRPVVGRARVPAPSAERGRRAVLRAADDRHDRVPVHLGQRSKQRRTVGCVLRRRGRPDAGEMRPRTGDVVAARAVGIPHAQGGGGHARPAARVPVAGRVERRRRWRGHHELSVDARALRQRAVRRGPLLQLSRARRRARRAAVDPRRVRVGHVPPAVRAAAGQGGPREVGRPLRLGRADRSRRVPRRRNRVPHVLDDSTRDLRRVCRGSGYGRRERALHSRIGPIT